MTAITLEVPDIYAPGHVLTADEARALNAARRENITRNFKNKRALLENTGASPEAIAAAHAEYCANYRFAGTQTSRPDPVEVEAKRFAKQAVVASLRAQKIDPYRDLAEGELEAKVSAMLEDHPSIRVNAAARVAELQAIAAEAFAEDKD